MIMDEIKYWKDKFEEEKLIVDKIWQILGSSTYEELKGRSIYELIRELQSRNDHLEAENTRLYCCGQEEEERHKKLYTACAAKDTFFQKIIDLYTEYVPIDGREDFLDKQVEKASKLAQRGMNIQ